MSDGKPSPAAGMKVTRSAWLLNALDHRPPSVTAFVLSPSAVLQSVAKARSGGGGGGGGGGGVVTVMTFDSTAVSWGAEKRSVRSPEVPTIARFVNVAIPCALVAAVRVPPS